jgi:hypothetical protein
MASPPEAAAAATKAPAPADPPAQYPGAEARPAAAAASDAPAAPIAHSPAGAEASNGHGAVNGGAHGGAENGCAAAAAARDAVFDAADAAASAAGRASGSGSSDAGFSDAGVNAPPPENSTLYLGNLHPCEFSCVLENQPTNQPMINDFTPE